MIYLVHHSVSAGWWVEEVTADQMKVMLRALHLLRAHFEDTGTDTIRTPDGTEWTLWDIEYLFEVSQEALPERQAEAIRFHIVEGMTEREAAITMGVAPTNPVGIYARNGLVTMAWMVNSGMLPRYQMEDDRSWGV